MSHSPKFETWWAEYQRTGKLGAIRLGMMREDVRPLLGEPDDTAKGWRKRPLMGIWKYGDVEFHFGLEGELYLIFIDEKEEDLAPRVIAQTDPPTPASLKIIGHDEASRLKSLAVQVSLPEHRLRFYAQADEAVFTTVQRGIVFIMAFWSGPAQCNFKLLGEIIKRLDTKQELELVILDTDGIPRLYERPPFGDEKHTKLGGWGEAAWVRNGRIEAVFTGGLGTHKALYEQFTKELLQTKS